jgi:hypothetical protein
MTYDMRLPHGNDYKQSQMNELAKSRSQGSAIEQILANIVLEQSEIQVIRIEAFYFCEPGKTMKISKSYRIDMSTLWPYYARKLSEGFDPNRIRNEIFLGPNSGNAILTFLQNKQIPSEIGDISDKLSKSISDGDPLDMLLKQCAVTALGQKTCISGKFFERLWSRDVKSLFDFFEARSFDNKGSNLSNIMASNSGDKLMIYPNLQLKLRNPYITSWFFKEDYMSQMGRDATAYNWNYNRFLDVNTTIFWILFNMQQGFNIAIKQFGGISNVKRGPFLVGTNSYVPVKHQNLINHRFSLDDIGKLKIVRIYDTCGDNRIEILFNGNQVSPNPEVNAKSQALNSQGQALTDLAIVINIASITNSPRSILVRDRIKRFLDDLFLRTNGLLTINKGFGDETQIIPFAPTNQTINDIPVNYYILVLMSSFMRWLIKTQEFSFFSFR